LYLASHAELRGASRYRELDRSLELLIRGALDLRLRLCSLFGPSNISIWAIVTEGTTRLWGLLLTLLRLPPLIAGTPRTKQTCFLALGALACLHPLFTTVPQDRLWGATFGAFGIIASFLSAALDSPRRWLRVAQRVFVVRHFLLAPLGFLLSPNANEPIDAGARALLAAIPRALPRKLSS
jgi:hypothetical protein